MTKSNQVNQLADRDFDKSTILWANTTIIPPFTAGTGKLECNLSIGYAAGYAINPYAGYAAFLISTSKLCRLYGYVEISELLIVLILIIYIVLIYDIIKGFFSSPANFKTCPLDGTKWLIILGYDWKKWYNGL